MKTTESLSGSIKASIKLARKTSKALNFELSQIDVSLSKPEESMPRIRKLLAELNKSVHEFNAYYNVANTN